MLDHVHCTVSLMPEVVYVFVLHSQMGKLRLQTKTFCLLPLDFEVHLQLVLDHHLCSASSMTALHAFHRAIRAPVACCCRLSIRPTRVFRQILSMVSVTRKVSAMHDRVSLHSIQNHIVYSFFTRHSLVWKGILVPVFSLSSYRYQQWWHSPPPKSEILGLTFWPFHCEYHKQEAQLMLTTGSTRLAVSRGQQTWYHSTCYI